eukprot:7101556-Prymnesium_polylepis.1
MLMYAPGTYISGPVMDFSAITTVLAVPIVNQALFVMFIYGARAGDVGGVWPQPYGCRAWCHSLCPRDRSPPALIPALIASHWLPQ